MVHNTWLECLDCQRVHLRVAPCLNAKARKASANLLVHWELGFIAFVDENVSEVFELEFAIPYVKVSVPALVDSAYSAFLKLNKEKLTYVK